MNAGRYQITWDGRNNAGARVASGMYFFELRTAGRTYTKRSSSRDEGAMFGGASAMLPGEG